MEMTISVGLCKQDACSGVNSACKAGIILEISVQTAENH